MSDAVIVSIIGLLVAILSTIVVTAFRTGRMLSDVLGAQKSHAGRIDALEKHEASERLTALETTIKELDKRINRDFTPTPVFVGPSRTGRHNR